MTATLATLSRNLRKTTSPGVKLHLTSVGSFWALRVEDAASVPSLVVEALVMEAGRLLVEAGWAKSATPAGRGVVRGGVVANWEAR